MNVQNINFKNYKSTVNKYYFENLENQSYECSMHTHDCFQIIYCKQGSISHHMTHTSSKLLRGDIIIIPPYTPHHISINEDRANYFNISFVEDILDYPHTELIQDMLRMLKADENIPPKFSPAFEDIYLFESVIGKLDHEYEEERFAREDIIISSLIVLLLLIARLYIKKEDYVECERTKKRRHMDKCILYLDTHYDDSIDFNKMIKMAVMSKTEFCDMFKKTTGTTFVKYLNKKRIERTQTAIRNGDSIMDSAYRCGYKDFSTFYRNFVRYTGVSPSEYKRRCKNEDF